MILINQKTGIFIHFIISASWYLVTYQFIQICKELGQGDLPCNPAGTIQKQFKEISMHLVTPIKATPCLHNKNILRPHMQ